MEFSGDVQALCVLVSVIDGSDFVGPDNIESCHGGKYLAAFGLSNSSSGMRACSSMRSDVCDG